MKWLGAIWRYRRSLAALCVLFVLAAACGAHWLPLLLLAAAVATHTVFAVSLGLFLSGLCRSTMRAYLTWVVVLLVILVVSLVLGEFVNEQMQVVNEIPLYRVKTLL